MDLFLYHAKAVKDAGSKALETAEPDRPGSQPGTSPPQATSLPCGISRGESGKDSPLREYGLC
jgi:hypothetical protein